MAGSRLLYFRLILGWLGENIIHQPVFLGGLGVQEKVTVCIFLDLFDFLAGMEKNNIAQDSLAAPS